MSRLAYMVTWITMGLASVLTASAATTVTDQKGITVDLMKVTTKSIEFEMGDVNFTVPVKRIAKLMLRSDQKMLTLETICGNEWEGKSRSNIEGIRSKSGWKSSVSLTKIRSVEFDWSDDVLTQYKSPDGFVVSCTDRSGLKMQVDGFHYNFHINYGHWNTDKENRRDFLPFLYKGVLVGIPFAAIKTVRASDSPDASTWLPPAKIQLTDDRELTGKIGRFGPDNHVFVGETKLGTFELPISKVSEIQFDHSKDKNAERMTLQKRTTPYSVNIRTWEGLECQLRNAHTFQRPGSYRWAESSTAFELRTGEVSNKVGFDQVHAIRFSEHGKPEAQLTTPTHEDLPVTVCSEWLGGDLDGDLDGFGAAWIAIKDVESIEVSGPKKP